MTDGYSDYKMNEPKPGIRHYYGDYVRFCFLAAAVVSFVALPLWGDLLPFGLFAQITGGLILVLLAGLTNPHSKVIMVLNAIAAGVGALLVEATAITRHAIDPVQLLLVREIEVVLLVLAFYFAVKTARSMFLHKVGETERPWEFDKTPTE
ncbi:MAG: hypothetical protein AAB582_02295 [Patescibacteria group bacterium]